MFGESETGESPRVASPWQALIDSPPSPKFIPKLVPEVEEGNVEYKLQLLSPSPARFARLVTQLKWRLLEGGGQAYYELGVADSGALIGLHRKELERTLETLECMAGEIGASVIVVREIEVPKGMHVKCGDKAGLYMGQKGNESGLGKREKRRWRRVAVCDDSTTTDDDGNNDEGSPSPMTLDTSPGLFAMDPDPDPDPEPYLIDFEMSSVYKPRPTRLSRSPSTSVSTSTSSSTSNSRLPSNLHTPNSLPTTFPTKPFKQKWHPKKEQREAEKLSQGQEPAYAQGQTKQQAKALKRRFARDRRREEKRRALALAGESTSPSSNSDTSSNLTPSSDPGTTAQGHTGEMIDQSAIINTQTSEELVSGLESLHVTMDSVPAVSIPVPISMSLPVSLRDLTENLSSTSPSLSDPHSRSSSPTVPIIDITSPTGVALGNANASLEEDGAKGEADEEVRLIVEALVVRKLSLEEAFLDFGGFSLI